MNNEKSFKKGFKYRIYPDKDQTILLNKTFGSVRYVWNRGLSDAKKEYEQYLIEIVTNTNLSKPNVLGYDFVNKIYGYKNDPNSLWLLDISHVALEQAMLHLGKSYSIFFKKAIIFFIKCRVFPFK